MEQDKKYGGTAVFFGSVLAICIGLIIYNINSLKMFEEIDQKCETLDANASFFAHLADKYFSLFTEYFGNYPPVKVLAVLFPISVILTITFVVYIDKFARQKKQEKMLISEENLNDQSAV